MSFLWWRSKIKKHYRLEQTWYVQCNQCGIRTPNSVQAPYESWKTTMNYPVRLWNRRMKMGMTIDKTIEFYNGLECYTPQAKDARDVAIDTMRKYQKIERIIKGDWEKGYQHSETIGRIRDVVEDGKNN